MNSDSIDHLNKIKHESQELFETISKLVVLMKDKDKEIMEMSINLNVPCNGIMEKYMIDGDSFFGDVSQEILSLYSTPIGYFEKLVSSYNSSNNKVISGDEFFIKGGIVKNSDPRSAFEYYLNGSRQKHTGCCFNLIVHKIVMHSMGIKYNISFSDMFKSIQTVITEKPDCDEAKYYLSLLLTDNFPDIDTDVNYIDYKSAIKHLSNMNNKGKSKCVQQYISDYGYNSEYIYDMDETNKSLYSPYKASRFLSDLHMQYYTLQNSNIIYEEDCDNYLSGVLCSAAEEGHTGLLKMIYYNCEKFDFDRYIDINDMDGRTALSAAISGRHLKTVKWLLYAGADKEANIGGGRTPYSLSMNSDSKEIRDIMSNS